MRIFLTGATGATGVIGRRALPLLIGAGHSVTAVVRRPQSHAELVRAGATPIEVDLFAADAVRKTVAGQDAVVNLATHMPAGYRAFLPGAWAENDRIRRFASANLVDAAMATGATRFIQESFAPVYPDRGDQWIDERTPIAPVRYNRTVADAERSAERFSGSGGAGVVLRFAMFYGPDSWFTRDLIGYVRRGWAPIPGVADAYTSLVSHEDAAAAVVAALGVPPGTYNVVDDEPLRRRELFEFACRRAWRRPTAVAAAMAEISVRFARRDAGAQPAHPEPQAARRVRLGAQISEHARGLARGRRRASMTVAKRGELLARGDDGDVGSAAGR